MLTIAIDGPGGAGKSTVADDVAEALSILHLDTGAMYRAVGLAALRSGIDTKEESAVSALANRISLDVEHVGGKQRTLLDGEDVSSLIRTREAGMAASDVSRYASVRKRLVAIQRALASRKPMILDGRDIGTNVLPDAKLKVFLTASPEARAKRRWLELREKGEAPDFDTLLAEIKARDHQDSTREIDPLRPAADAVLLDTSDMTQAQVAARILELVEERV